MSAVTQKVSGSEFERANELRLYYGDEWENVCVTYQNLAELHAYLGALAASADAAREALDLARRLEHKRYEMTSLAYQAWAAHLCGDLETVATAFRQAEALEQKIDLGVRYLYGTRGIWHAEHMQRAGDAAHARRVTQANLKLCERNHFVDSISHSHRVLGNLDADAGQHESARQHYDEAIKIAQGISDRPTLIQALLARGRWAARHMKDANAAFSDLNEALGYAVQGGYRIYEADIRIGLAWAYLTPSASLPTPFGRGLRRTSPGPSSTRRGEIEAARAEAEYVQRLSQEMGYHWGQVDAEEVMQRMKDEGVNE